MVPFRRPHFGLDATLALILAFGTGVLAPGTLNAQAINPASRYTLDYGTYIGGTAGEENREPLLLSGGRLLFGIGTESSGMPTTPGAVQSSYGGGVRDGFLVILSADGATLEAATYFGGSAMERPPYGIGVASDGDIIFCGATSSPNLPTTAGAYRSNIHMPIPSPGEGYAARISPDFTTLRWVTYLGGGWPRGGCMVDSTDHLLVAGRTSGVNFTTTPGTYQTAPSGVDDVFVMKFLPDGTDVVFSSIFGGNNTDVGETGNSSVRLDSMGNIYVGGISTSPDFPTTAGSFQPMQGGGVRDSYLVRLNPTATALDWATYLGGSGNDLSEHPMLVMPDDSVLMPGTGSSMDFPVTPGAFQTTFGGGMNDAWLARVDASGASLHWATYIGWGGDELLMWPAVDSAGNIYLAGNTSSTSVPTSADAIQMTYNGGPKDGLLVILSPDGANLLYASYIGGMGDNLIRGMAIGPSDELYLIGRTNSSDFPVTMGSFQSSIGGDDDGFVLKLTPMGPPAGDAGVSDSGVGTDAGPGTDAAPGADSAMPDDGGGPGTDAGDGGGGGCRCAVGRSAPGSGAGMLLLMLALGALVVRRSRRP